MKATVLFLPSPEPSAPSVGCMLTTEGLLCLGSKVICRLCEALVQDHPEVTVHDPPGLRLLASPFGSCPQFLRDTLVVVSDDTWICRLSLEMCKQLPCYNRMPQEKVHWGVRPWKRSEDSLSWGSGHDPQAPNSCALTLHYFQLEPARVSPVGLVEPGEKAFVSPLHG